MDYKKYGFLLIAYLSFFICYSEGVTSKKYFKYNNKARVDSLIKYSIENQTISEAAQAIKLAELVNYPKGLTKALRRKAYYLRYVEGDYLNAKTFYNRAINVSKEIKDKEQYAESLNSMGAFYHSIGQFTKAHNYFLKTLKVSEKYNLEKAKAISLTNLGAIYFSQEDYEKAVIYETKALKICRKDSSLIRYVPTQLSLIGNCYMKQGDHENAEIFLLQSVEKHKESDNKEQLGASYSSLGELFEAQKNYLLALNYYENAFNANKRINHKQFIAFDLVCKGRIYNLLNKPQQALEFIKQALNIAEQGGFLFEQNEANYELSRSYIKLGNYEKGLEFFKRHKILNDSINKETFNNQITEQQTDYELEKKEQEVHRKEQQIKYLTQNNKLQKLKILAIVGAIFLILFIFLFVYIKQKQLIKQKQEIIVQNNIIHKKEKEAAQLKIEIKNKALTTYTLQAIQKNRLLNNVKSQIEEAVKKDSIPNKGALNNIVNEIKRSFVLEKEWKEFKLYFEDVHQGFFKKVKTKYPSLTEKDLKLCAFFKLGISSKQIATLTGISPQSVNIARYRLRKKLDLKGDDDLVEEIKKII